MKTGGSFIITIILSLSIQAQTVVTKETGTIRTTSSSLYKAGKELVVSISIDITRDLSSNESMVLVPIVCDTLEHRLELPPIYINSRKQHIVFLRETSKKEKSAQALQRKNGNKQTMHYLQSVPFEQWMNQATLSLIEKSCGCGIPDAEDFICIARLHPRPTFVPQLAFLTPQVETSKIRTEKGSAFIDFPVNVTAIHKEFSNNVIELNKIIETINTVKNDSNVSITRISIHGYASPDGPLQLNERLARERTRTLKEYVSQLYPFDGKYIHTTYTPEDWEGFEALLSDTTFQDKEAIMKIVTSNMHPDRKEEIIRMRFPAFYRFVLKQEMFRLALTYTPGSATYNKIFMTAVQLFPDNPTANLNAACIALIQKDTKTAAVFLEKAPPLPETTLAKGVLCFLQGNYKEAEALFRQSKDAGLLQADDNLKQILEVE